MEKRQAVKKWWKKIAAWFKEKFGGSDDGAEESGAEHPGEPPAEDDGGEDQPLPDTDLPQNPNTGLNKPGSISESFSVKKKSYDSTYRITWPSYFRTQMGLGESSICTANGYAAQWKGIDDDNESSRPKYSLPLSVNLEGDVLFLLYDKDGRAVAWIKCVIPENGCYLPEQAP